MSVREFEKEAEMLRLSKQIDEFGDEYYEYKEGNIRLFIYIQAPRRDSLIVGMDQFSGNFFQIFHKEKQSLFIANAKSLTAGIHIYLVSEFCGLTNKKEKLHQLLQLEAEVRDVLQKFSGSSAKTIYDDCKDEFKIFASISML